MTARLGDHGAGRPDPRALGQAHVNPLLEAEHGTAEVTGAGEAAHQHVVGGLGRRHRGEGDVIGQHGHLRQDGEHQVGVGIDEARHQGLALAVDALHLALYLDGVLADPADEVALHQHGGGRAEGTALAIEDAYVFKQDDGLGWLGGLSRPPRQEGAAQDATEQSQ